MTGRTAWAVALAAVVFASCSKCGGGGGGAAATRSGVERQFPRGAVAVVIVPSLDEAGARLKLIQAFKVTAFAAQLQGFPDGKALGDALVAELGLDVRSHEALEQAGVDGARSAGVAMLVSGNPVLALPVKDATKFHATLETLAKRRLGTTVSLELPQDAAQSKGAAVKTFAVKAGGAPALGYVVVRDYALVTDGAGVPRLPALAAMGESDALSSDQQYLAELERLPGQRDLVVWLPGGTPALVKAPFSSAMASVALTPLELSVTVNAVAKPGAVDLAALTPQAGGKDLLGYLPRDAFVVMRYQGDPAKLGAWVKLALGPYLNRAFDEAGFDLEGQALAQLQPGVVAALSLSERPPMDRGMPALDLRQTNPFTYAHLSGAAAAKSKDVALPVLEKVAAIAPKFGASMELRTRADGQSAMVTTYSQGEGVHFAPREDLVFFASPIQRLDALVKSDGKGGSPVTPLKEDAFALAIDLSKLSASVRALPESAWGLGGFAIKATTVRWLDATDDLKGVSLSVGAKEQRVQARLQLTLGGAAK